MTHITQIVFVQYFWNWCMVIQLGSPILISTHGVSCHALLLENLHNEHVPFFLQHWKPVYLIFTKFYREKGLYHRWSNITFNVMWHTSCICTFSCYFCNIYSSNHFYLYSQNLKGEWKITIDGFIKIEKYCTQYLLLCIHINFN